MELLGKENLDRNCYLVGRIWSQFPAKLRNVLSLSQNVGPDAQNSIIYGMLVGSCIKLCENFFNKSSIINPLKLQIVNNSLNSIQIKPHLKRERERKRVGSLISEIPKLNLKV